MLGVFIIAKSRRFGHRKTESDTIQREDGHVKTGRN